MNEQEVKKCVSILYDMEQNLYMMTRIMEKYDEEIAKKSELEFPVPEKPIEPKREKHTFFSMLFFGSPISDFLFERLLDIFGEFGDLSDFVLWILPFLFFLTLGILLLPINMIIGFIMYFTGKQRVQQRNEKKAQEYKNACKEYQEKCNEREVQIYNNAREIEEIRHKKESMRTQREESQAKLNGFYQKVGINEKFRGLLPMSYMADFINLGIATKFEGADGLYYLVLKELQDIEFRDTVTSKIDEVVKENQKLHGHLERMKRTCDIMVLNTKNKLTTNTVESYQNERIAKELEYQTYLMKKSIYG